MEYDVLNHSPREGQQTILLVEDDPAVALTLTDLLESEGYGVAHARNVAFAKSMVEEVKPDLVLLDLMLPDGDGLVLCSDMKARTNVPIIICSASNRKRDAVLGFKLGADDYISKPFHVDELVTRIQAALRRSSFAPRQAVPAYAAASGAPAAMPVSMPVSMPATSGAPAEAPGEAPRSYQVGDLFVDHARRNVRLGDAQVDLTPTEYRLVSALASRPEEVLSRQDLAQIVWGYQDASIGRSIDVHLHRLRSKLKNASDNGAVPPQIISVRGFGYKITTEDVVEDVA
ncbi:MAG TPA: response regulator transcription factor [Chloroflexota bacterium]|nr:response regulator transcription factor [Chloroflexota bacterium]